jgi:hypothetical protein
MATFLVRSKLRLSTRSGLFLVGEITSGTIRAGMVVRVGAERGFTEVTVAAVEFVDHSGGHAEVALRIACKDPDEERLVEALCADGDTVDVADDAAGRGKRRCDECGSTFFVGTSAMTAVRAPAG